MKTTTKALRILACICFLCPVMPGTSSAQEPAIMATSGELPDLAGRMARLRLSRVSFDAMPLSQALETLSAMSEAQGLPINLIRLSGKAEEPKVTLTLRDMSLERVLYYMASSVGYVCEMEADAVILRPVPEPGSMLRTDFFPINRSALVRITGLAGVQAAGKEAKPQPTQAEVEAATLSFFERAGVPFQTVPGATLALGSGQLIVTNSSGNIEKLRGILARYQQTKQVRIEARFLEVGQADLEEFGLQWGLATSAAAARGRRTTVSAGSEGRSLASAFGGSSVTNEILITGLDENVGSGGVLSRIVSAPQFSGGTDLAAGASPLATVSGVVGAFDIEAVISALSRKSGNNLMSAPRLTVLSGERAEITVAQEMIYPQSFGNVESSVSRGGSSSGGGNAAVAVTAGTPRDFTTRNVGVEMGVCATVEDDGSISLILEPCVTEFEGFVEYGGPSVAVAGTTTVTVPSGFYQPVFSVRRIRTELTIDNGATVVMGGLTREETVSVDDKVPLLGDIPLLGRLFRSKGESTQKKDLLIFVSAHIVGTDGLPLGN